MNKFLAKQVLVEFYNCSKDIIDDVNKIEILMNKAVLKANATIIKSTFHKFAPQGVSGVVVIAESHFAIHTWPEHNFASVDLYTCGTTIDENKAILYLKEQFNASKFQSKTLNRGNLLEINKNI